MTSLSSDSRPPRWPVWSLPKLLEATALFLLLVGVTELVFTNALAGMPLAYLPLPFILWAAFRFNRATVLAVAALICFTALWHTMHARGPFASIAAEVSLMLLATYGSVVLSTACVLCTLLRQRDQSTTRLRRERDLLEVRVQERTAALLEDIRHRKRVEQQLDDAQQLSGIGSWELDLRTNELHWSGNMYRLFGVDPHTYRPRYDAILDMIPIEEQPDVQKVVARCREEGIPFAIEHRFRMPTGQTRIVSSRGRRAEQGPAGGARLFGTVQDITEAKQAEQSLREAEERYRMVVELSPDAILVQQGDRLVFGNPAAFALLGASDPYEVLGKMVQDFMSSESIMTTEGRSRQLGTQRICVHAEEKLRRVDGSRIDVEVHAAPFTHQSSTAALLILRDITERKRNLEQMAHLAHFDSLTGLPNRMLFRQRLEHALQLSARPGHSVEVLFLDLDRFKNINDTLGHAVGDLVLQETARRLHSILRESDTVARLGGDEFVVLVENTDEPHRGGVIAEKILAAFAPPFLQDHQPLSITTSIGIACYPRDGNDAETLLKHADIAMYRAKETGRNNYHHFSPELNQHTAERLSLEYALGHAIENRQLLMLYQPKVDVVSRRIAGMEALLRWQHPTLGLLPPDRFIPLAEETGLIRQIGYWAIRTACRQNRLWQDASSARLKVSVNLSARQLGDEHLVDNIAAILKETGLEPAYLELELTETAVMSHPEKAMLVLAALHDTGISVAIDDFGVGYSSLAYLKQFPIRTVKIDRSFVHGIPGNHGDSAITKAIIGLAHSLDCTVIAEGTETPQQFDFLREHECDSVQGFLFSEPMNADLFGDLLRAPANLQLH